MASSMTFISCLPRADGASAGKLLEFALASAAALGIRTLHLEVEAGNEPAVRLYPGGRIRRDRPPAHANSSALGGHVASFGPDELCCNAVDSYSAPPLLAAQIVAGLDAEFTSLNETGRRPPRSMRGRHTIGGAPTCTALRATAIVRRSSSSPERSPSTDVLTKLCGVIVHAYFLVVSSNQRHVAPPRAGCAFQGRHSLTSSRKPIECYYRSIHVWTDGSEIQADCRQSYESDPLRRDRERQRLPGELDLAKTTR